MRRSTALRLIVLFLIGAGLLAALTIAGFYLEKNRQPTARLSGPGRGLQHAWPLNHCWSWQLSGSPADDYWIEARIQSLTVQPNESVSIEKRRIPPAEATRTLSSGAIDGIDRGTDLDLLVQVVDPSEVGIESSSPLWLRMRLGTNSLSRGGSVVLDFSEPIAGSVAGTSVENRPRWEGNELHVMNLFVRTEQGEEVYDICVVHGKFDPSRHLREQPPAE